MDENMQELCGLYSVDFYALQVKLGVASESDVQVHFSVNEYKVLAAALEIAGGL